MRAHQTRAQAVCEFSADATRWALADAGDGMDDANFETSTANAAILRITKELVFIEECLAPQSGALCACLQQRVCLGVRACMHARACVCVCLCQHAHRQGTGDC